MHLQSNDPLAQALTTAIQTGDLDALTQLLAGNPALATAVIDDDCGNGRSLLHIATDWPGYFPNAVDPKRVTVSATGRNVLTIPLDDPNGRAGIYLTVGNVTYVLDGNGNQLEAFTGPGKVTNICRVLA